ncbi:hypothetical protein [Deinococcus gobiensis]|uniref:Uncharacterized protein n=1 Tax=Deinococcus gobiensis (strain DSM 21396 / JCM 16679 / CGMCC 1.7299 / I-0) TaxID=745776 RepID=H8GXS1_DEIGI|nr:hypothetical protein [Deinococcus gobiensis]AFD25923.1 hypothetical protein DGo_CA1996 [Deinococcus gobiensis I-0]
MGFRDSLKMLDVRSFLNASARRVLLYVVGDDDGTYKPVTESMLAGGGSGGGGSAPTLVPLGNHITLALDGTARAPTWPAGTLGARIGVSGGSARVAVTAPEPTSTTGLLWADGSTWELTQGDIAGFKATVASGSPVLDIQPLGAG